MHNVNLDGRIPDRPPANEEHRDRDATGVPGTGSLTSGGSRQQLGGGGAAAVPDVQTVLPDLARLGGNSGPIWQHCVQTEWDGDGWSPGYDVVYTPV